MATPGSLTHQPTAGFYCSETIQPWQRVKLTAGSLDHISVAVQGDADIGVAEGGGIAEDRIPVRLRNAPGTVTMIASGAITVGAEVFPDAAGKVSATRYGAGAGLAVTAAAADGDTITVLRAGTAGAVSFTKSQVGPSTLLSNAVTTAQVYDKSITFPANTLKAGMILDIENTVTTVGKHASDTCTARTLFGTQVIASTGSAYAFVAGEGIVQRIRMVIRSVGATGKAIASFISGGLVAGAIGNIVAEFTIDTTVANTLTGDIAFSAGSASNTARMELMTVLEFPAA